MCNVLLLCVTKANFRYRITHLYLLRNSSEFSVSETQELEPSTHWPAQNLYNSDSGDGGGSGGGVCTNYVTPLRTADSHLRA
jgi:hypothetical protein